MIVEMDYHIVGLLLTFRVKPPKTHSYWGLELITAPGRARSIELLRHLKEQKKILFSTRTLLFDKQKCELLKMVNPFLVGV